MADRFVLLDRDGTIIFDRHYLHDPAGVELLPGAAEGLRRIRMLGWRLAVLTNQSGVGRGYFDEAAVHACNGRMVELLRAHGVELDGIFFCPHAPEVLCNCRKPAPGLAEQAAATLGFDARQAVMIGDKDADMLLGRAVGASTILVRTGKGAEHEARCRDSADHVVDDLDRAADIITTLG